MSARTETSHMILPDPPGGHTGWPWEPPTPFAPESRYPGTWPRVSIVTPSYNQGCFIEETIQSVIRQDYPNLEYIVMDGGSTDETVEILRKYDNFITYWDSARDHGAADALAKGFERASGEILAYLNSDDIYLPGTLHRVAERMRDDRIDVVYGNMLWMTADGQVTGERRLTRFSRSSYLFGASDLMQPSTFWRRTTYDEAGGFNADYRFAFDTDLFFRFVASGASFSHINHPLSAFRIHSDSKSTNDEEICTAELARLRRAHLRVPFDSIRGRLIRTVGWARRALFYTLQGDALWLLGRIPDRITAPWSSEIVGPRGRRV